MTPIIILTGFLGSGKTSLLSRLVRRGSASRTLFIINEYGEISLDHDLVEAGDETVVDIGNGCLCCRSQSSLAATLQVMAERRAKGDLDFSQVVIETSGLVDPVPILGSLAADASLRDSFYLAEVVTVVDAVLGVETLKRFSEARRQVAVADLVLITKSDLVPVIDARLVAEIRSLNAETRIHLGEDWGADSQIGLGTRAAHKLAPIDLRLRAHASRYNSVSIVRDDPVDFNALMLFLEGLTRNLGPQLLRLKGIVNVKGCQSPVVVHGVQHLFCSPTLLPQWPSGDRRSRIVLIGQRLPKRWPDILFRTLESEVFAFSQSRHASGAEAMMEPAR